MPLRKRHRILALFSIKVESRDKMVAVKRKQRFGQEKMFDIFVYVICIVVLAGTIYPLYLVAIASISNAEAVLRGEVLLIPKGINLTGYKMVFENQKIGIGYLNTIIYAVVGTLFNMAVTLPAAYAMSRKEFVLRKILNIYFVFTMFFNGGIIATYICIRDLSLINNRLVFIVAFGLNVYNLIITRSFFEQSFPEELREAALIDGCGHWRYFTSCVLPLSKAIIMVISLYYFVWHWNDFYMGLVYARDTQILPLQNILRSILLSNQTNSGGGIDFFQLSLQEQIKYASIIVASLPLLVVYPFLQRFFAKGVMLGAVKG